MFFTSKRSALITLGVTALISSRSIFFFFDDPEGPNLLIVTVTALVLFCISLTAYALKTPATQSKKLLLAIGIQVVASTGLYFLGTWF